MRFVALLAALLLAGQSHAQRNEAEEDEAAQQKIAGFIAVYAGKAEAEAKQFLAEARAKFPDANLRRMRVMIINQLE